MEVRFCISGSVVFVAENGIVPPIGSEVIIRLESYKKGMFPGTILRFRASDDFPPSFDFVEDAHLH